MRYLEVENMREAYRVETTFTWQERTQNFEACCKPFCLVTRRGFATKSKARRLPLEQVFKRKRRCLLNGNEKSTLLEEKKKRISCDLQNHIETLSMEARAHSYKTQSSLFCWPEDVNSAAGEYHFVRTSFCSLLLFCSVIILKWILIEMDW